MAKEREPGAPVPPRRWPLILADGDGPVEFRQGEVRVVMCRVPSTPPPAGSLTPRTSMHLARLGMLITAAGYAEPNTPASPLGLFLAVITNVTPRPIVLAQGADLGQAIA